MTQFSGSHSGVPTLRGYGIFRILLFLWRKRKYREERCHSYRHSQFRCEMEVSFPLDVPNALSQGKSQGNHRTGGRVGSTGRRDIWYNIFNCNWVDTRWQQYSTHLQTIHRTTQLIHGTTQLRKSAGRAPSLRGIPWHLPYSWGKSTEKAQSG